MRGLELMEDDAEVEAEDVDFEDDDDDAFEPGEESELITGGN